MFVEMKCKERTQFCDGTRRRARGQVGSQIRHTVRSYLIQEPECRL